MDNLDENDEHGALAKFEGLVPADADTAEGARALMSWSRGPKKAMCRPPGCRWSALSPLCARSRVQSSCCLLLPVRAR